MLRCAFGFAPFFQHVIFHLFCNHGKFCFGSQPTLADCCLIPQVYNALRFHLDLSGYPKICSIYTHCNTLEAFQHAAPEMQLEAS
jgi:maleylacetoacetate isomerase